MNFSTSTSEAQALVERKASWRYTAVFLLVWWLLLFLPALLVIVVDPHQVFHPSWLPRVFFHKDNERYQLAGLLKHYLGAGNSYNSVINYDSVIIGSSISSNISTADVQAAMGWQALNLGIRASSLSERTFVLQQALQHPNVRHVLLEIYAADALETVAPLEDSSWFPTGLYTGGWLDKRRYVFNVSVLGYALMLLDQNGWLDNLPAAVRRAWPHDPVLWREGDVGHWNTWIYDPGQQAGFSRFNEPAHRQQLHSVLAQARQQQQRELWQWRTDYPFASQMALLLATVQAHPEVEFVIWFAPTSLARYASEPDMDFINRNVEFRRYLVRALAGQPHVKVFGFDNDVSITADLRHYMDYSHFSPAIQHGVLQEIAAGRHQLTQDMIDAYAGQFRNNILAFDVAMPSVP